MRTLSKFTKPQDLLYSLLPPAESSELGGVNAVCVPERKKIYNVESFHSH